MIKNKTTKILIVGAGGIGSQLLDILIPALTAGDAAERMGGVQIHIMDDDRVEVSNISHQRHEPRMIGRLKVESLSERLTPYQSPSLSLTTIPEKLLDSSQLEGYDLVVVAVDRPDARTLVHSQAEVWLDLRCSGDGYMAMDYELDPKLITHMTPLNQAPASCQYPSAVESGNIQFGFAAAAAHGAQWIIQKIRTSLGEPSRPTPSRMFSLTYGELGFPLIEPITTGGGA